MNAKEVSKLTGVSVRTLHHYDEIGLLSPRRNEENGYRRYGEKDLDVLQQILFFKACGFTLDHIGRIMSSPEFDREEAFRLQRRALLEERRRIDAMLHTLDRSIQALKGEKIMSQQEKFTGFDFSANPYEEEARKRWGDEAVDKSNRHYDSLSEAEKQSTQDSMNALFRELGGLLGRDPGDSQVQDAVGRLYRFFNSGFGITYSPEAFAGLGQMYVDDSRFTKNIDRFGEGLSAFLAKAMKIYADSLEA